jgi:hypothetical protein
VTDLLSVMIDFFSISIATSPSSPPVTVPDLRDPRGDRLCETAGGDPLSPRGRCSSAAPSRARLLDPWVLNLLLFTP